MDTTRFQLKRFFRHHSFCYIVKFMLEGMVTVYADSKNCLNSSRDMCSGSRPISCASLSTI